MVRSGKRLQGLKRRYFPANQDAELHVKNFAITISDQVKIADFDKMSWTDRRSAVLDLRKKTIAAQADPEKRNALRVKHRRTEPFIHLSRTERSQLLEDTLELVGEHEGIRIFGEAIAKSHPAFIDSQLDCVKQGFEQVLSRFDSFLQRRYKWKQQGSTRPAINNGLMIMDQDYTTEASIERQFKDYRQKGHPWGELRHVIDVPFFASSEKVGGLQLVDICAYAVRRYLDQGAVPDSHEENNFLRIFHRFDREQGHLHGLRHYVPTGTCHCLICRSRGHYPYP
jgi:hypothetical protein